MGKYYKAGCAILFVIGVVVLTTLFIISSSHSAVMNPKGMIAEKQRDLIVISTILMLIVVIPVFLLAIGISWRYRANNKAKYTPDWDYNLLAELIWWGLPCLIVFALSVIVWKSSHDLDPFKPLDSNVKPIKIQVVALQWKWLFIYPEEGIASVNLVQFPEKTPINFEITADAPMNSFWIPQLGGQIYAMQGMNAKLHLIADEIGSYRGSSANLSGVGFAGMRFEAVSTTQDGFDQWVASAKQSSNLGMGEYTELAKPSENNRVEIYSLTDTDLFNQIIMKYMVPQGK